MRTLGLRVLVRAGVASVALLGAVTATSCTPAKPPPTLSSSDSWCPDGFESGPQDTCFAVPESPTKDTPVIIYLHGMYAGHGSAEEWSLVRSVTSKGFAVVVPRGKRGLCAWKAELKDHFCWPQETDDPEAFKHVVKDWERVLWQVDAILEAGNHKRYVLGFSNGGFFAAYMAEHGLFPAQAYAIVNGGPLEPAQKPGKTVPVMLVSAQDDPSQAPKMKELHDGLAKVAWPHAFCTRPGQHPIAAEDIDAATRFFKREGDGSLKASSGGTYACEGGTTNAPGTGAAAPSDKPEKAEKSEKPAKKKEKKRE